MIDLRKLTAADVDRVAGEFYELARWNENRLWGAAFASPPWEQTPPHERSAFYGAAIKGMKLPARTRRRIARGLAEIELAIVPQTDEWTRRRQIALDAWRENQAALIKEKERKADQPITENMIGAGILSLVTHPLGSVPAGPDEYNEAREREHRDFVTRIYSVMKSAEPANIGRKAG